VNGRDARPPIAFLTGPDFVLQRARILSQLFPKPVPCPLTWFLLRLRGQKRKEAALVRVLLIFGKWCDWHGRAPLQAGAQGISQPPTPGAMPLPMMGLPCAFIERIANH
jgi:hypothetical protein